MSVREVVRDLVLLVFDRAVEHARAKFPSAERLLVTREDLVAAVIELRYEQLALACAQLEEQMRDHERAQQAQHERIAAEWASGDHADVEVIEPDGTEQTTQPFKTTKK